MGPQRMFGMTPWVRRLFVANLVVFLFQMTIFVDPRFLTTFGFVPLRALAQPWTFVTYMFLHGGPLHLAFNLLALYVFGPEVEERMGGGQFLGYYLLCGLGGAGPADLRIPVARADPRQMARDVRGRRVARPRHRAARSERQGVTPGPSRRLRGGISLSEGRRLATVPRRAASAARGATERAGPPGPGGPGGGCRPQAAPPAARCSAGGDRPGARQDLGARHREPHPRRAKVPRRHEPEDARQGLRGAGVRAAARPAAGSRHRRSRLPARRPAAPRGPTRRRALDHPTSG